MMMSAGEQDLYRVGEQRGGLLRCGGQAVNARGPGPEFHAAFEVDGPDNHVPARGEVGQQFVQPAAFAGSGRAAQDGMAPQEQHAAGFGIFERP